MRVFLSLMQTPESEFEYLSECELILSISQIYWDCFIVTFNKPVFRRISETIAERVVQENLGRVVPRLHRKEHDLVCSIIMVYHHGRKGCWALSDVHSPGIAPIPLQESIAGHGLDIETAEFTWVKNNETLKFSFFRFIYLFHLRPSHSRFSNLFFSLED